ncbi:YidB family protein [Streptomyces brasiliensis]|uniref:DUF937 domain-containing protein n=1 Tax=Streptomyces brasiliensis TaxID=1954 RepID=A0A917NI19_9ACTN|nr:YidB family protein [Streptomyces brasiliensis]GGJ02728.1 hypothetical protein GCM10010121_011470 [Streptomyces brasiliensis]
MAGDDLDLGKMLGQLLDSQSGSAAGGTLGTLLSSLAGRQGGGSNPLGGLLDMLAKSGTAQQKDSWAGNGPNRSVTGSQIQKALPDETIRHVAQQAGDTPQQAADEIAHSLPRVVDRLTPTGQMPSGTSLEDLAEQQNL